MAYKFARGNYVNLATDKTTPNGLYRIISVSDYHHSDGTVYHAHHCGNDPFGHNPLLIDERYLTLDADQTDSGHKLPKL